MDNIRSLIESGQGSISFTVTAEALRAYGIAIAQEVLNAQPQEDKTELLTVEEAGEVLAPAPTPKHVHGLAGIASLFGCSIPTAYRIKKSGIIDAAITQIGRKIVVDAPKALELAGKKKGGRDE